MYCEVRILHPSSLESRWTKKLEVSTDLFRNPTPHITNPNSTWLPYYVSPQASITRVLLSNSSLMAELKTGQFDAVLCEHMVAFGMVGTTFAAALNLPVMGLDCSTLFWDPPPEVPQVRGRNVRAGSTYTLCGSYIGCPPYMVYMAKCSKIKINELRCFAWFGTICS